MSATVAHPDFVRTARRMVSAPLLLAFFVFVTIGLSAYFAFVVGFVEPDPIRWMTASFRLRFHVTAWSYMWVLLLVATVTAGVIWLYELFVRRFFLDEQGNNLSATFATKLFGWLLFAAVIRALWVLAIYGGH